MKCPHCGQEHPDNFQFCPVTGKKIEIIKESTSELIACTNPLCDDYGKKVLPADSRFCPTCGTGLNNSSSVMSIFMSLYDITLGKTNIYNIDADEYIKGDSPILENEKVISINHYTRHGGNISFVAKYSDKKVFGLIIDSLSDFEIPSPWISIGVDSNNITLSFEKILGKCGFDLEEFEDNEGKHVFSYKQLNTGLFLVLVIDNEWLGIFLGTEEMKNRSYHEFVSRDFQDEEGDNDVEVPSCPKCGSDDVKDDGSGYLQYECNGCGNIWGHDDKEECPECGSHDIEDDGTGYLQYKCNNCDNIWGDDDEDLNDEEYSESFKALSLDDFFPVCGITLDKSTVNDARRQAFRFDKIERCDGGLVIAWWKGIQIRKESECDLFTHIYMTRSDKMFPEWNKFDFDWNLSYNEWISLFKKYGFTVIQTKEPRVSSWEHGPDYLEAELVTVSKDYSLKFKLDFSYGRDGCTQESCSTLYSISVSSESYSFDNGGSIGEENFYNLEDFCRTEPKKYL